MKTRPSKLDQFTDRIEEWFGAEKITIAAARYRLAGLGCHVSSGRLSQWWSARQQRAMEDQLLARVASGAQLSREIESRFARNAPPEVSTIIQLLQTIILQLGVQGTSDERLLLIASNLLRPVMEWQKLEQSKAEFGLAKERFQRETCELFVQWAEDQQAKDILSAGNKSNEEKIAAVYQLMFGGQKK